MSNLETVWADYRANMAHDYSYFDANGNEWSYSCVDVAEEIGDALRDDGLDSYILRLSGLSNGIDGIRNTRTLAPLMYEGNVRWGSHFVCEASGVVYDPILEEPVPLESYAEKAFGDEIAVVSRVPSGTNTDTTSRR